MKNNGHITYYNKSGEEVPSVTTVLKIFGKDLTGWANWMGLRGIKVKEYVEEKASLGTYIHSLAERYFTGDMSVLHRTSNFLSENDYKELIKRFDYLSESLASKGFYIYASEFVMEGERCGGTADIIFYNEELNKYMLLDFKTSAAVYETMFMQLGGYTSLLKETKDIDIDFVGIILIMRDPTDKFFLNIKTSEDNRNNQEIFNKLLDIYYLLDTKSKPK